MMMEPVDVPSTISVEWVQELQKTLDAASRAGTQVLQQVLPYDVVAHLIGRAERLFKEEAALVEIQVAEAATVTVVGDTHGQFHDVCKLLEVAGCPSEGQYFIFNGDFVDRGAWGIETLVLLLAWKLAMPHRAFLLRGNHECTTVTLTYGFQKELAAKYGKSHWRPVFTACKKMFACLPLAAVVQQTALVLHGGLFRQQVQRAPSERKNKRKQGQPAMHGLDVATLGSLADLRVAHKGGLDPNGMGASRLATDVMWSDPVMEPGFAVNVQRGVGMIFGPDVTERFLRENGLRLILRSHEGPDAREGREDMGSMLEGYTLDHDTPEGRLMTVFSAPDYPQFMPEHADRYRNKAAVAVLSAPDFGVPRMVQFEADIPRPEAVPYYDLAVPDSDEEFEPAASDLSGMTGVSHDVDDLDVVGGSALGGGECQSSLPAAAAAASAEGATEAVEAAELPLTEAAVPSEEAAAGKAEPPQVPGRGRDAKRACRDRPATSAQDAGEAAAPELVVQAHA